MAENEKFNGDCKLLQDRLRRFCELVGEEVRELPGNIITCDMAYDTTLTLYAEPLYLEGCVCYGFIGYKERMMSDAYIVESNVQYLYDKMNEAIAIIEQARKDKK